MRNKAGSCELGRKNRKGLSISYALNVQLCMLLQLIDGSRTEADIIVSFFNLPHNATLQGKNTSYH